MVVLLLLVFVVPEVLAAPWLGPRAADSRDAPGMQIWVPILVVGLLLLSLSLVVWSRYRARRALVNAGATEQRTELTAEQLAGTIRNSAPRPRRRNRRTPSQISTTSLPVYMKEPGELELVIFRGPADMEDAALPAIRDSDDTSAHTRNTSNASQYSLMPTSPADMPLLDNDTSQPPGEGMPVRSSNDPQLHSSIGRHPSIRSNAPAYFDVVNLNDDDDQPNAPLPTTPTPPPPAAIPPTSPEAQSANPNRRSGFLNMFSSRLSSNRVSEPEQPASSTSRHRPSQSGSSSFLSGRSNPLSRKKSSNTLGSTNLNSPSTLSVNSISSPLTHTLVRTEFTYPKTGPTPDQLKLISSRETFARFGVPYGADAITFAASTQDLVPPPEFEERPGSSTSQLPGQDDSARELAASPEPLEEPSTSNHAATQPSESSTADTISPPTRQPSEAESVATIIPAAESAASAHPPTSFKPLAPQNETPQLSRSQSVAGSFVSVDSFATASESIREPATPVVNDFESQPTRT